MKLPVTDRRRARAGGALFALLLLSAGGCRPDEPSGNAAAPAAPRQYCATLAGRSTCFDEKIAYLPDRKGFLLELPLGALDAPCNRTRHLYHSVMVLFAEEALPDPAAIRRNNRDWDPGSTVTEFGPGDYLFQASTAEFEECQPAKGGPARIACTRHAAWNGLRIDFTHDQQCQAEARAFARTLEQILRSARR